MKNDKPVSNAKVDEQLIADKFFGKAWIIVSVVLLFAVFLYRDNFNGSLSSEHGRWGEFGDFFAGILNPLISFLTLLVASKVWQLQQRELAKTQEALQQQVQTNELQRFENTIFKLIEHCHNSIKPYSVQKSQSELERRINPTKRFVGLEAVQYLASKIKIRQHLEGQLSPTSVDSIIEEFDAFGFYESFAVIKYAYVFSLKNCPIESRSSEYATMTYMLIGDETMFLCRFWAIACEDDSFLELLPKDEPTSE